MSRTDAGTERKRRAAIYREAAWRLEAAAQRGDGWPGSPFSCDRIGEVMGLYRGDTTQQKRDRFNAERERYTAIFGQGTLVWWPYDDKDSRVLALCFMAAMVEAGDA